ncbi:riboflavin synthase subunit alpha [Salinibacter sp. 10B]|uniref:riboflavin synthase n=1 Tax=Salinibacter sp. 10B TaxID=1923971 RepID=UPI000CF4976A|nr:riboflavin synthase [Salinibacter sp. 10B]PQJ35319.1 riboflavin synthase subunit alpha [Salinibacter sp. 10B]
MFTGIIEEVGTLTNVEDLGGGKRLTIEAEMAPTLRVDQSVSINGACQTVVAVDAENRTFAVDSIEETLRKTTFGRFTAGAPVNLERALQAGDRLDGHFVQGHVDATGTIVKVEREETDWLYTIQFDPKYAAYLIPVGSISVDGISLTVARLEEETFTVAIIPHTYKETNVADGWTEGAAVNLEFDLIGKYVTRSLTASGETPDPEALAQAWGEE